MSGLVLVLPVKTHESSAPENHLLPRAQPCSALGFPCTAQLAEPSRSFSSPERGREQSWASPCTREPSLAPPEQFREPECREQSPRCASHRAGSRRDRFVLLSLGRVMLMGLQQRACSRSNQLPAPVDVFLIRLFTLHRAGCLQVMALGLTLGQWQETLDPLSTLCTPSAGDP